MWVYISVPEPKLKRSVYAVGFFGPPTGDERSDNSQVWYETVLVNTEREARALVSYLNGGHRP